MIKISNILIGFILVAGVFSCHVRDAQVNSISKAEEPDLAKNFTGDEMTIEELIEWCANPENKLSKPKDIADIRFRLSYLPAETMAFLELRTEKYDFAKFTQTRKNYSEMTYFNFRIEVINGSGELLKYKLQSPSQYDARIKYMSFDMQQDLYLVQGKDTLRPGLFQFERIFEVAPFANVMFAFDNKEFNRNSEFTLVYNDRLFEKGFVKFNYKNKQLINLPTLVDHDKIK